MHPWGTCQLRQAQALPRLLGDRHLQTGQKFGNIGASRPGTDAIAACIRYQGQAAKHNPSTNSRLQPHPQLQQQVQVALALLGGRPLVAFQALK